MIRRARMTRYYISNSLDAISVRVDTLEGKQTYPYGDKFKERFLFATDSDGALLETLIENNLQKYSYLLFRVLYKNILSGCFALYNAYLLYLGSAEQNSTIKNWLSQITLFFIQYKNELDSLSTLKDSNCKRWKKLFEQVKVQFVDTLMGGENIRLHPCPLSRHFFRIESVSNGEI